MLKRLFYGLTLVLSCQLMAMQTAYAKTLANNDKVDKASDFFMAQIQKGEFEAAYSLMSAYAGVDLEAFLERGQKTATEITQLQKATGEPLSVAKLKTQNIGEHFYKITYLVKYRSAALVWELNYYQPESGWVLVDVAYNANIDALFD